MIVSDDEIVKPDTSIKAINNAPMLIAVFLILLTIFVMLITISKVDKPKLENLVHSVNEKFSTKTTVFIEEKDPSESNETIGLFFKEIESWALSVFSVEGLAPIKTGNSVMIRIPVSAIFEDGTAQFTKDAEPKMEALAGILSGWMQNFRVTAEIVLNIPTYDSPDDKSLEILAIDRASLLAESMTKMQVKGNNISPGIRRTTGEYADFIVFRFAMFAAPALTKPSPETPANNTRG